MKKIKKWQEKSIIETGEPRGLFWRKDGDVYVGVDNSTGDAWIGKFDSKEKCFAWLAGELEITDGE